MTHTPLYDVAIIGAGPIGIETAICLKQAGVNVVQFDAHQIAHTMSWWPRNTTFFSTTERLAIAGVPIPNSHQGRITGEEYIAYLRAVVEQFDLQINTYEPVTSLCRDDDGFELATEPWTGARRYRAKRVIMAIGDMQYPNRLNIPGEDLPHVTHYFRDPHDYFRKRLLIVGGKNSAVEAALRCWRAGAFVTISYRKSEFDDKRVKHWLLPDLLAQIETGAIRFLPETTPVAIEPGRVLLRSTAPRQSLIETPPVAIEPGHVQPRSTPMGQSPLETPPFVHETDFVFLATGYHGDQSLLEAAGVDLHGENRVPVHKSTTMETNVPGLYVVGTAAAGIQQRYVLFIENSHAHAGKVTRAITGQWPSQLGDIRTRTYELALEKFDTN